MKIMLMVFEGSGSRFDIDIVMSRIRTLRPSRDEDSFNIHLRDYLRTPHIRPSLSLEIISQSSS